MRIIRKREVNLKAKIEDGVADETEKWHDEKFEQLGRFGHADGDGTGEGGTTKIMTVKKIWSNGAKLELPRGRSSTVFGGGVTHCN